MDNRTDFRRGLNQAAERCQRIMREIDTTRKQLDENSIEEAYLNAFTLANESEKLTLITRDLAYCFRHPNALIDTEEMILEAVPVKIGYTHEGWFSVVFPSLLPKKEFGSTEYIRGILSPALRRFFFENAQVYYPECVIIFRHVFHRGQPERAYRDLDNFEVNMVTDIVASFVMHDDSALRCFRFYCGVLGDSNRTEVYVVNKAEFEEWREKEKHYPDCGPYLLENYP